MHREIKASRRYAKSLLDLAIEQNKVQEISADMALIHKAYTQNKDLLKFFKSPLIKADKKEKILHSIFSGKVNDMTMRFLVILVNKRREGVIPGIAHSFREQLREYRGIALAEVTTAVPLDTEQRANITKLVENIYDKVELKELVKPEVIAGFSIKVGDKLYDETISSRIKSVRRYYWNNPYVSKF